MIGKKLTEFARAIRAKTGFDKFVTMNGCTLVGGLAIWITLYNVMPNHPDPEEPKTTKSNKKEKC